MFEVSDPSRMATIGIKKKCIGTSNGEWIESEVTEL